MQVLGKFLKRGLFARTSANLHEKRKRTAKGNYCSTLQQVVCVFRCNAVPPFKNFRTISARWTSFCKGTVNSQHCPNCHIELFLSRMRFMDV